MTEYKSGDIVVINNIDNIPKGSLGVVVTGQGFISALITVYIFMYNRKEINYSDNARYIDRFKKTFKTLALNDSVNVLDNKNDTSFIEIEEFFEVSDVGINSLFVSTDNTMITRLDETPYRRIAFPIGLEIVDKIDEQFEVVKCTDEYISLLSWSNLEGAVLEDNMDNILEWFISDPTISDFKKVVATTKPIYVDGMNTLKNVATAKQVKKKKINKDTQVFQSSMLRAITKK